jgi:hypothetical protein
MHDPVAIAKQIEDERERQLDRDLDWLLNQPPGRRITQWLIFHEKMGALMSIAMRSAPFGHTVAAIKDGSTAREHAAFHDGKRALAVDLYNRLTRVNLGAVLAMQLEHGHALIADVARLHPSAEDNDPGDSG